MWKHLKKGKKAKLFLQAHNGAKSTTVPGHIARTQETKFLAWLCPSTAYWVLKGTLHS